MSAFLSSSSFFAITLTLIVWKLAGFIQSKTKSAVLNPILLSVICIIAVLLVSGIPYSAYQEGMRSFSYLMTPATICLAVPCYEQLKVLKNNLPAMMTGVVCGTLSCLAFIAGMCLLFGFESSLSISLLPKSITTAIAVPISEAAGGVSSITVAAIICTGVLGNITGSAACRLFKIDDPVAQGVSMGTASHVIGTARANEMGAVQGAVSSLSLVIAGVLTAFIMPLISAVFQ